MNKENIKDTLAFALGELRQSLEEGKSESLQQYLDFISNFNRYSFHNTMLILAQCPEASMVAGYTTWKKHGRYVKKGAIGIAIYAPMDRSRKRAGDRNEETVLAKRDQSMNSTESQNEASRSQSSGVGYRVVNVFDISQTEGNDLVELERFSNSGLIGDPGACLESMEGMFQKMGILLETKKIPGLTRGYSIGNYVAVREGLSDRMRFRVLVHELAHSVMHFKPKNVPTGLSIYMGPPNGEFLDHSIEELEAESVAYTVCRACGIDSTGISSDYIKLHQGDSIMLVSSMNRIQTAATRILSAMDKYDPWQDHVMAA